MNKTKKSSLNEFIKTNSSNKKKNENLIPNDRFIIDVNKGLIDSVKHITEFNITFSKTFVEEMMENQKKIEAMLEPFTKKTFEIQNILEKTFFTFPNVTEIFEKIDWSKHSLIFKEISIIYLSNGFYPYSNTKIEYEKLLSTKSRKKQIQIIKKGVEIDIKKNKKELLSIYPEHKKIILELYKLFDQHNYRLCILSLINLISVINNSQFEYIDFTQKSKIRSKLLEKQIISEKETNYMLFAPYIKDDNLWTSNMLIKSYREQPEKYSTIPYNRNAILHGYSKKFGTKENCLRWFSVLQNSSEISKELMILKNITNK